MFVHLLENNSSKNLQAQLCLNLSFIWFQLLNCSSVFSLDIIGFRCWSIVENAQGIWRSEKKSANMYGSPKAIQGS